MRMISKRKNRDPTFSVSGRNELPLPGPPNRSVLGAEAGPTPPRSLEAARPGGPRAEAEGGGGGESTGGGVSGLEGHRMRAGHHADSGKFHRAPSEGGAGEGAARGTGGSFSLSSSSSLR